MPRVAWVVWRCCARHLAPLAVGVVTLATGCTKDLARGEIAWERDVDKAVARSRAEHKPLMIMVGASWDTVAAEYDHVTFKDAATPELTRFTSFVGPRELLAALDAATLPP